MRSCGIASGLSAGAPHALALSHDHVRDDVARLDLGEAGARARVEARGSGAATRAATPSSQPVKLFSCVKSRAASSVEVLARRSRALALRCGVVAGSAFSCSARHSPRRARADAGGLEVLQVPQRDRQLLELDARARRQQRGDLLEVLRAGSRRRRARRSAASTSMRSRSRKLVSESCAQQVIAQRGRSAASCGNCASSSSSSPPCAAPVSPPLSALTSRCRSRGVRRRSASRSRSCARLQLSAAGRRRRRRRPRAVVFALERGFPCRKRSISWLSSSVDSCSSRIDCCSCGVSVRCWESWSWSECFMAEVMRA